MSTTPSAEPAQRIRGVFSTQEIRRVGTGTTTRKTVQKTFWFVEQLDNNTLESQPLNNNYVPSGPKRKISMEDLINKYSPEPEFYLNSVYPKMQEMNRSLDAGDKHREKGETFAAEFEYDNALKLDEENVRANFGIGLTYLQRGDKDKAEDIFERLLKLDAAFEEEHKHLFNEFGITLRKSKMFDKAVEYYSRALELTRDDENLQVNLARAYVEAKDFSHCVEHLFAALDLAPNHENAIKFLEWLVKKNLVPADQMDKARTYLSSSGVA